MTRGRLFRSLHRFCVSLWWERPLLALNHLALFTSHFMLICLSSPHWFILVSALSKVWVLWVLNWHHVPGHIYSLIHKALYLPVEICWMYDFKVWLWNVLITPICMLGLWLVVLFGELEEADHREWLFGRLAQTLVSLFSVPCSKELSTPHSCHCPA